MSRFLGSDFQVAKVHEAGTLGGDEAQGVHSLTGKCKLRDGESNADLLRKMSPCLRAVPAQRSSAESVSGTVVRGIAELTNKPR